MELHTNSRHIGLNTVLFDEVDERPIDCDVMLPDFLPDIAAVLKCSVRPVVQNHQISGDRLLADGTVYLQVLYLDEDRRRVYNFDLSQPFTSSFTIKNSGDAVHLTASTSYVNCRATGPRRLDIHGACRIGLTVEGKREYDIVEGIQGDDVYTKGCDKTYTVLVGCAEKSFTVNETLELPRATTCILRQEVTTSVSDCKQLTDKAVVKGDLFIKTVYVTDAEGTLACAKNRIPFSQIVDVNGLTEATLCDVSATVLSCDARLSGGPTDDNTLVAVNVKTALKVCGYTEETCTVLEDAFHTAYPLHISSERLPLYRMTACRRDSVSAHHSMECPESDMAELMDVWSDVTGTEATGDSLSVYVNVCLLARDVNGMVHYYERPCTLTVPYNEGGDVAATVLETEGALVGGQIDLHFGILLCGRIGVHDPQTAVTAIQIDETTPYSHGEGLENCQVKICFADAGESVWEIAKQRHASPEALKAENNLTDDVLKQRTMLLIPLI